MPFSLNTRTNASDCFYTARSQALLFAAENVHLTTVSWLLSDEGGAKITEKDSKGDTVWVLLERSGLHELDAAEMASLLRVMLLLSDAPTEFHRRSKPQHARIIDEGQQLRARLPAYLTQQRALITDHSTLPAVLQPLVAGYAAPTPEDLWADGLRWL